MHNGMASIKLTFQHFMNMYLVKRDLVPFSER